jgi:hypothetical protein
MREKRASGGALVLGDDEQIAQFPRGAVPIVPLKNFTHEPVILPPIRRQYFSLDSPISADDNATRSHEEGAMTRSHVLLAELLLHSVTSMEK